MLAMGFLMAPASAEEEESFSPDLALGFIWKEDGATLSPQNKLPDETEAHTTARAEYDDGILGRYNREATKVGEWTTEEVAYDQAITIDQAIIWWEGKEADYTADCEWTFYFRVNGENIEDDVFTCSSDGEDLVRETWSLGWSYDLVKGDNFGFEVWYEGWEDADIYHDNITYDTGFKVTSKPLSVFKASISGNTVSIEFAEAWPVDWKINLRGGYVMMMGMDGYMADNNKASVSQGTEHEMANGTVATGTVITWDGVTGKDLKVMLHYTQFDHMANGTGDGPIVTLGIVAAGGGLDGDGEGFLGLPGFPLLLAIPAFAFASRRR
jgi:hypothetical protein